jgi:hypothetical protein
MAEGGATRRRIVVAGMTKWLTAQSGEPSELPRMSVGLADGHSLPDAPGHYVRQ